jgi:hypothetical protein
MSAAATMATPLATVAKMAKGAIAIEGQQTLLNTVKNGMVGKNAKVSKYFSRFDLGKTSNELPHVHFNDPGKNIALNMDGTWKHKPPENWNMPTKARNYLESFGITIAPW